MTGTGGWTLDIFVVCQLPTRSGTHGTHTYRFDSTLGFKQVSLISHIFYLYRAVMRLPQALLPGLEFRFPLFVCDLSSYQDLATTTPTG